MAPTFVGHFGDARCATPDALNALRRTYLMPMALSSVCNTSAAATHARCYLQTPKTGSESVKISLGLPFGRRKYIYREQTPCRNVLLLLRRDPIQRFISALGTVRGRSKGPRIPNITAFESYGRAILQRLKAEKERCYRARSYGGGISVLLLHLAPQSFFASLVPADAHVAYSTIDDFVAGRSGLPCTFTAARKINAHEGATLFMRKLSAASLSPGFASELRAFYADDYALLEAHGGSTPVSSR